MTGDPANSAAALHGLVRRMTERFGVATLGECSGRQPWPARGVYFFLDAEEFSPVSDNLGRVVRVGTHGLKIGSSSTLWQRLRQHKGQADGSGNHRGSVFRKHVGASLLVQEGVHHSTWGVGSLASREVREAERDLEKKVSRYLSSLLVTHVPILDEPGPDSLRGYVEANSVAVLSAENSWWNHSSERWLGAFAPSAKIAASGLWNVRHVGQEVDHDFLAVLERVVLD